MHTPDQLTFGDFAQLWLRDYGSTRLKATGYAEYESLLRVHLVPAFGAQAIRDITPVLIQTYLSEKVAQGLSPRTVANHLVLLRSMFRTAVVWRFLALSPAAEVAAP